MFSNIILSKQYSDMWDRDRHVHYTKKHTCHHSITIRITPSSWKCCFVYARVFKSRDFSSRYGQLEKPSFPLGMKKKKHFYQNSLSLSVHHSHALEMWLCVCMCVWMYARVCVGMFVCMGVYLCVCVCVQAEDALRRQEEAKAQVLPWFFLWFPSLLCS